MSEKIKRICFICFLIISGLLLISISGMEVSAQDNLEISNEYISFTMPQKTKGTYSVEMFEDEICICEKISMKKE